MQALITRSSSTSYAALTEDGQLLTDCRVKGNFRIKGIRTTNPVAVGDHVTLQPQPDGSAWITAVEPRQNYIIRRSTNLSKESQILAANIDLAALVVSINYPQTALTFVDRFLVTAEAYHIPAMLIINKVDLYDEADQQEMQYWDTLYNNIGYPTQHIVARNPESVAQLLPLLENKTILLAGNSGVGKSTLINTLLGHEITRTGEISVAHNQGMHTTTFSEMYVADNFRIIDTPGVRGFGVVDMEQGEVRDYFPEIRSIGEDCRFSDCKHLEEPGCAVRQAVEDMRIAPSRWDSYLSILGDCSQSKYR